MTSPSTTWARTRPVPAGIVSNELVDLSDVFPTLADLAGAEIPEDHVVDGESLVPTLLDPSVPHREWIFSFGASFRMFRDANWLLDGRLRLFWCGEERNPKRYIDRSGDYKSPPIIAELNRIMGILGKLPNASGRTDVDRPPLKAPRSRSSSDR